MEKTLKTVIKLRRDTEDNYKKYPEYKPLKGEVAFIESNSGEVRMKVGDGETLFSDLEYADSYLITKINDIVNRGYFIDGQFYKDAEKTITIVPYEYKVYVDIPSNVIYTYDGEKYVTTGGAVQQATDTTPGIMKLYNTTGVNTDGTMTQNSITNKLSEKFKVAPTEDETLIFTNN